MKSEISEQDGKYEEVIRKLDAIEKRLFRDNGTLSMQTRLERHEQVLKILVWVVTVVGGSILTSAVGGPSTCFGGRWCMTPVVPSPVVGGCAKKRVSNRACGRA
jgi:hypothetical protein